MSADRDAHRDEHLDAELRAFGRTLERRAGDSMRAGSDGDHGAIDAGRAGPSRRWWAMAGAAACVVVAVGGLLALDRRDTTPPAAAPPVGTTPDPALDPATSLVGEPTTTTSPTTTTTTIAPTPLPLVDVVGDDPLGLLADGWTLVERSTDPFELGDDDVGCAIGLSPFTGTEQVHDIVTPPDGAGIDVDVEVLRVGTPERADQLAVAIEAIGPCLGQLESTATQPLELAFVQASGFRAGDAFALVTVTGTSDLAVVLEIEGAPFGDDLIDGLARRAAMLVGLSDGAAVPAETTTTTTLAPSTSSPELLAVPVGGPGEAPASPQAGEVLIWVSNQSFDDDPVAVTIEIDGEVRVSDVFAVEGQHNWQGFLVPTIAPGEHTLTATSSSGASLDTSFTVLPDGPRYLVVDYWYYPDDAEGRHFTFVESADPVAFD